MKKGIWIAISVCLVCSLGLNAYSIYSIRDMDIKYQKKIKELDDMKSLLEDYKGQLREKELQLEEADKTGKTEELKPNTQGQKNNYIFEGFEVVYSAFSTQEQIDMVKEAVTEALKTSEYKSIQKVSLSAYTRYDQDKFLEYTYARLDDKAVMEIAYSIRYGTATVSISDISQKDLTEMEKYGTTVTEPGEETVVAPTGGGKYEGK